MKTLSFSFVGKQVFACFAGVLALYFFASAAEVVGTRADASGAAQKIETLRLPLIDGMTRAELKHEAMFADCAGVLVLCPGYNGDGEYLIREKGWREFARKHRLLLVGLSFASKTEDLSRRVRRGYYYVERGSGGLLLEGLKKITKRELPVVIFGFSGGAHFVHRFVYEHSAKVKVWGVYGFGWFREAPQKARVKPPGIFVCGLEDERLKATRDAFLSALRAQWSVAWMDVPRSGHTMEARAISRVREFFGKVLVMPADARGKWKRAEGGGLDGFSVRSWEP
jgi:hypothetical protein